MRGLPFLAMCVVVLSGARLADQAGLMTQTLCPSLSVPAAAAQVPASCTRLTGEQIGQLPLELTVGGEKVRFVEWSQPDLDSPDAIGFRLESPADVVYAVQAGDQLFPGTGAAWSHPAGIIGPRVHAIDSVTLCRMPERPKGCVGPSVVLEPVREPVKLTAL